MFLLNYVRCIHLKSLFFYYEHNLTVHVYSVATSHFVSNNVFSIQQPRCKQKNVSQSQQQQRQHWLISIAKKDNATACTIK